LVYLLETSIEMQFNRTEHMFLRESREDNISVKRTEKMLRFTVRKMLTGTIVGETFWSPF
jgi:hypothetical protein